MFLKLVLCIIAEKREEIQVNIIDNFITLTQIPHCSHHTDKLFDFLVNYAKKHNYTVQSDEAKNILISKGSPKLALQAHYDMVCMGEAPKIETYVKDGWMYAKNSSLGADNGIAIAMMMSLMERGEELEFLLTADEEVGLVGAGKLDLKLNAHYMLNVDYEDEGIVCIGCAGGADIVATQSFQESKCYPYVYEVSVTGLMGGHSGVDIDKNIPNAIKILANYLEDKEILISSFLAGERHNSIPANARVNLASKELLEGNELVEVKPLEETLVVYEAKDFIELLAKFKTGIHDYNEEFKLADTSINLAIVSFEKGQARVECSSRAMSAEGQSKIDRYAIELLKKYGYEVTIEDKYSPWRPEVNEFTSLVNQSMEKVFGESRYEAIHAGLECGVILERYPYIKFASIGPNIDSPHSTREGVELASVEKTFEVIEELITKL